MLCAYQEQAAALMAERKQMAALLKMGLGKTVITLTALADLGVGRALVFAPAPVVARDVWGREARAWEHTAKADVAALRGSPQARKMLLKNREGRRGMAVEVCSYENALWLTDTVDLASRYQAIVFDELSKVKAPGTARFRRLRARSMEVPIRFGLTGSPVGNRLLDLWGEMFMVAGEKPLGGTYSGYRARYFVPEGRDPRFATWRLRDAAAAREIHERVAPYAFSLDEKLASQRLPEVRVSPVYLPMPSVGLELEKQLAAECTARLASGEELRAIGASALGMKVRQLCSGAVYLKPGEPEWSPVHDAKLEALHEILDEQQGEPVLVFYWFAHEAERILKAFPHARLATDQAALDAWDKREVPLLLAHPQSAGHGLNLQAGGSTVVWFALPWSHELWEQGNGRLARPGQQSPWVTAIPLLVGESDSAVYSILREKGETQRELMDSVRLPTVDISDLLG